jgi:hypothetical protein
MKWIKSNGNRLEVRDCSEIIYTMVPREGAVLPILNQVMSDEEARAILEGLKRKGLYDSVAAPAPRK